MARFFLRGAPAEAMIEASTEALLAEFDPSQRGAHGAVPITLAEARRGDQAPADRTLRPVTGGPREAEPIQTQPQPRPPELVTFDRRELDTILNLYGKMVAAGEWRDYAIDFLRDRAVFSVFRRAAEVPLYRIEKDPKLARKQGAFAVITATGLVLKRGPDLARVIRVIDRTLKVVAT